MKKILALAAFAACLISTGAHAATLDITLGPSVTYFYNAGQNIPASNIVLTPLPPNLSLVNNSLIIPAGVSLANQYKAPTGITGPSYLAVLGLPSVGDSIFTLNPNNQFSFTWGSVDSYNSLTLKDATHTFLVTGTDILGHIPGPNPGNSQVDVQFLDVFGNILTAELQSTRNSFEVGNFSQTATPLPASLLLFASGLGGLFFLARRRKLAKA